MSQVVEARWRRSYERATVEKFARDIESERAWIEQEITAARERLAAAREASQHDLGVRADLGALVLAAQQELETIAREHADLIDFIRTSAIAESERIRAAADDEVAAARRALSALAGHFVDDEAATEIDIDLRVHDNERADAG